MEIVITGIGLRSSLGSLKQSWQNLLARKSGIKYHQPFPYFPSIPLGLIEENPLQLPQLTEWVSNDALVDAQLTTPLPDCGVVIGSSRGCQAIWEQFAAQKQNLISLKHWLNTLPHQGAITVAKSLQSNGPVLAPMAACATGIWALTQGIELIQQGRCDRVIAGAVEAPITPLTLAGFQQMGVLAQTGCYPFDKHREGFVLAEGAAIFVLETAELARQRDAPIYAKVLGFGLTCDAYHVSTPAPDPSTAIRAIQQCLVRSQLNASDIDYIHCHGTGTRLNDQREAQIIQTLFPQGVWVSSTKGATGHTLGASGAIGIAFCLMALKHQQLPPCVGLKESEFDLKIVKEAYCSQIQHTLCLSFGFGGQNGVIALER